MFLTSCEEEKKHEDLAVLNQVATNETVTTLEDLKYRYGVKAAENYLDTAFFKKEKESRLNFYRYYYHKTYVYTHFYKDYSAALDYINILIDQLEKDKIFDAMTAEAYFVKGDIYIWLKNFPLAYKYYSEGIRLCRKLDDRVAKNRLFDRFGLVLYRQKYYNKAMEYFKAAVNEYTPSDTDFVARLKQQELLDNIALCYTNMHKYDSALIYYDSSLAVISKISSNTDNYREIKMGAEGVVLGNKAKIFLGSGNTQQAIEFYYKSIRLTLLSKREVQDACFSLVRLADIFISQKNIPKTRHTIDTLETILNHPANSNFAPEFKKNLLRLHRLLAIEEQDWKSAALFANEHLNIIEFDSTDREKRDADINDVLTSFEKERQMMDLRRENALRKDIISLVIALLTLFALTVIIVYYNWRSTRKRTRELEKLNVQIEEQRKQMEQNNKQLVELSHSKDRILGIVAHDLRNPIAAIKSFTDLMVLEEADGNREGFAGYMEMMQTACSSSLELINEIMLVSDMNLTGKNFVKQKVSLKQFMHTTVELMRFRALEKKQVLKLEMPDEDSEITVNTERFRRALSNLITNAIKFSNEGKNILVHVQQTAPNQLRICVSDEGIGIPDELKDKVFDTFTTAKRTGTAGEKPFGLGLSIVRQIVDAHNGRVWIDKREGPGTTFCIEIPMNG